MRILLFCWNWKWHTSEILLEKLNYFYLILKVFCPQETGSGNNSQKSDEDDFVKVEDVPIKLAVYSEVSC